MSRQPAPRTRVPYKRSFRPSVAECQKLIIECWYNLCVWQNCGDKDGVAIAATRLHDMGVFLFRARRREAQAGAA